MRKSTIVAFVIVLAASFGSSAVAQQGKGKGKGSNADISATTFSMKLLNDVNGNGSADWGDTVTFEVFTNETTQPYVNLTCYQNGTLVASSYSWPDPTTLSSRSWQSGSAECVAELFYFSTPKKVVLSTVTFTAGSW
jgi:hypothetical protein